LNQATRKVLDDVKNYVPPVPKIKKLKKSSQQLEDVAKPSASVSASASGYIFPGRNGNRRHDLGKSASRIRDAAGLTKDFRPLHGLRHHFGSMLASSGEVDLYTLQKLMTHKSPEMTARYAHLRDAARRRASDVADRLFENHGSNEETSPDSLVTE
jgi:integrase